MTACLTCPKHCILPLCVCALCYPGVHPLHITFTHDFKAPPSQQPFVSSSFKGSFPSGRDDEMCAGQHSDLIYVSYN